jgi:hypothetical protein
MSASLQPPELKHRVKTLAEKLFERIDQQPEKQPVGFVLTDLEDTPERAGIRAMLFGGILMLVIGVVTIGLLVGLVFILLGIYCLCSIPGKLQVIKRTNPGELILKSYPLRLGETIMLTFRRSFKQGYQAKTEGRVWGRLICLEVYRDNRGSGSATFYGEPVWFQDLPTLVVQPGASGIEQDWYIHIPEGTPTINIKGLNESQCVLWGVDVFLDIPGLIRDDSVFCLLVEPEVV